jgi:hypothetical protein
MLVKTLKQIQRVAEKGDYTQVAKLVGISPELVKKVIAGTRTDHHNIQKTFSDLLIQREKLAAREERRRERERERAAKRLAA